MDKSKFGIILVVLIVSISIFTVVSNNKNNNKENSEPLEIKGEMSKFDKEKLKEDYKIVNDKKYSSIKKTNYNIAMYYNNLNNKNFNNIKLFPEYIDFLNISSSEYLNSKYEIGSISFYEIIDMKNMGKYNKTLVKLKHKYENKKSFSFKTFSLEDNFILDEPFLFIKDINEVVKFKDVIFSVENKAVFDDKVIYNVIVKNNGEETFFIDNDKYGFYAIQGKNKYYHNLERGNITDYEVLPNTENNIYVSFDNLKGVADVYVKIKEKTILLTPN